MTDTTGSDGKDAVAARAAILARRARYVALALGGAGVAAGAYACEPCLSVARCPAEPCPAEACLSVRDPGLDAGGPPADTGSTDTRSTDTGSTDTRSADTRSADAGGVADGAVAPLPQPSSRPIVCLSDEPLTAPVPTPCLSLAVPRERRR